MTNIRLLTWSIFVMAVLTLVACGKGVQETRLTLSGAVTFGGLDPQAMGPVFVAVLNQSPMGGDKKSLANAILAITTISKSDPNFSFTLTSKVAHPGDAVFITAFADNDFKIGIPNPNAGDLIGYYVNEETLTPVYVLEKGDNTGIDIALTKEIFDYQASVSGRILGDTEGIVTVVAYAGDITSIDVAQIDLYDVIGFSQFEKGGEPVTFDLSIFPYGYNVPIENVYLIALVDANSNHAIDGGDRVGFYTHSESLPQLLTIRAGKAEGYDITPDITLSDPSGDDLRISGSVVIPESLDPVIGNTPLFVMVVKSDENLNLSTLASGDLKSISNFQKLTDGNREFSMDLSETGLAAGDKVVVIAVCDLAYTAGFPVVGVGDYIGYYVDVASLGPEITLVDGGNPDISLSLNKEVFDYEASLSGHIPAGYHGDATVFPYFGDIAKLDFSDMNVDAVPGYTRLTLTGDAVDFTIPIFPYGHDLPIENCYLVIFVDAKKNNRADAGDLLGFYTGESPMPMLITITGGEQTGFTLTPDLTIPEPSGDSLSISGHITVPSALENTIGDLPLFVIVAKAGDNLDLSALAAGDLQSIAYFERLSAHQRDFTELNLSGSGLAQGDKVVVIVLCDTAWQAGLPFLSAGDMVGYYLSQEAMGPELTLIQGGNTGVDITLSREVYDYDATLSGAIHSDVKGQGALTLFAYKGEINSLDVAGQIDLEQVIGFQRLAMNQAYETFQLDILPYGNELPIENVYLFAWLDVDGDGTPNAGDRIGYVKGANNLPVLLTVDGNDPENLFVDMSMDIPPPSEENVTLTGAVDVPEGVNIDGLPLCILVARAGEGVDMSALMNGEFGDLDWYEKLSPGQRDFTCDLGKRGLSSGDKVMVIAVCDLQQGVGFPDMTQGDRLGFFQNNHTMDVALTLSQGENVVETAGDTRFSLSRIQYDNTATLLFELNGDRLEDDLNPPVSLDPGETVTVAVVQTAGVDISLLGGSSIDMDYVVGYGSVTVPESGNNGYDYTIDFLPYIDRRITVGSPFTIHNVYIFAIFDGNSDPNQNNYLGYYTDAIFIPQPTLFNPITNGPNILDHPIRFTTDNEWMTK